MTTTSKPDKYWQRNTNGSLNYYTDTYSYNPLTNKLPSTTEHWKYIKYTPKNSFGVITSFNHLLDTNDIVSGGVVWMLYVGPGGEYGGESNYGGGGGGGGGEVVLSVVKTSDINPNNKTINCVIGKLNPSTGGIDGNSYTKITYSKVTANSTTGTNTTLTAKPGYCGSKGSGNYTGANGGSGGGYNGVADNQVMETFDTTTSTTIKFGSSGGGGGSPFKSGYNFGENGNRTTLSPEISNLLSVFQSIPFKQSASYNYIYNVINIRARGQALFTIVSFDIVLNGNTCDNTGFASTANAGEGGSPGGNGQNASPGYIIFFYKTTTPITENKPRINYKQDFPPNMNIYNYNPFTNKTPGQVLNDFEKPGEDWVYYKYSEAPGLNFKHTLQNVPTGEAVWVLYIGGGGLGGDVSNHGGGGSGGTGEVNLSCIIPPTGTNNNNKIILDCTLGNQNNYNSGDQPNCATTIKYGSTTLTAKGGFRGAGPYSRDYDKNTDVGWWGGNGAGVENFISETYTNSSTTYKFGSGGGGGGGGLGKGDGKTGDYCILNNNTYTVVNNINRNKIGTGVNVNFNVTCGVSANNPNGYKCDNTGLVTAISAPNGENSRIAGLNAPGAQIMIFHKTSKPLRTNFEAPAGASFGINPRTGFRPTYTNFINEKAYFYKDSSFSFFGLARIDAIDFNRMFNLTSTTPYGNKPKYLAVGGGGGGGSPWWCEYDSFGGGGGGGGQPKYGTVDFQTNTDGFLTFIVGGNGATGDKPEFTAVGNSGGNGGDTTITFANATTITAAGGGGGQNAADRRDQLRASLAGYGGGMGGRNNNIPSSTSGPSGGFGSCPIQRSSEASGTSYYDATLPANLEFYETGNNYYIKTFEPGHFTWYQKITEYYDLFSYAAHTTYGDQNKIREVYWRNGFDLNLIVSTDYFAQSSFRVTYGGDAGNDGLSGIRNQTIDWERSAYSGKAGGPGYILMWGKGPSGQVSSIYE